MATRYRLTRPRNHQYGDFGGKLESPDGSEAMGGHWYSEEDYTAIENILRDIHQQVDLKTLPSSIAVRIEALFGLVQDHGDPCQKNRT